MYIKIYEEDLKDGVGLGDLAKSLVANVRGTVVNNMQEQYVGVAMSPREARIAMRTMKPMLRLDEEESV